MLRHITVACAVFTELVLSGPYLPGDEGDAAPEPDPALSAPFAVPRLNFFHSALLVPPLESARPLPAGSGFVRVRSTHARSDSDQRIAGIKNDFDGAFHEWATLDVRYGLFDRIEVGGWLTLAGWDEHMDRFHLFDRKGVPTVRGEGTEILGTGDSSRHDNVSVVGVEVKGQVLRAEERRVDVSLALPVKFPVARPGDLTNAGTVDLSPTVFAGVPFSWGTLHASIGVTVPLGDQELFEEEADIDLTPFVHGAIGVAMPVTERLAVGAQFEAQSSAFRDLDTLDDPSFNIILGVRRLLWRSFVFEGAVGAGLDWDSSYQWLGSLSIGYRF